MNTQTHDTGATAPAVLTKVKALGMLIGVMVMSFGFIALCAVVNNHEFYAGFLFLLCWAVLEHTKLARLPHTIAGSICGVALGYLLQYVIAAEVAQGAIIFTLVVMVILYCQFMGWLALIANLSAFTFLLVVTIPHVQAQANFIDVLVSLGLGIAYFTPIIAIALHFSAKSAAAHS